MMPKVTARARIAAAAVFAAATVLAPRTAAALDSPCDCVGQPDRGACFHGCEDRYRLSLLLGPVINVSGDQHTQFAVGAEVAVPFGDGTQFFVGSVQAQLGGGYTSVLVPIGFQQDIAIPDAPVFAYLRTSFGYAAQFLGNPQGTTDNFLLLPEAGARWLLTDRITVGLDPFSFPVMASRFGANVTYRAMAYVGYSL